MNTPEYRVVRYADGTYEIKAFGTTSGGLTWSGSVDRADHRSREELLAHWFKVLRDAQASPTRYFKPGIGWVDDDAT